MLRKMRTLSFQPNLNDISQMLKTRVKFGQTCADHKNCLTRFLEILEVGVEQRTVRAT